MKKTFIIGGGIIVLLILVLGGIYFFPHENKLKDLTTQKSKTQGFLAGAEDKLNKEKQKLDTMTNQLKESFALAVTVQDQTNLASSMVHQTDFMFTDASGSKPELIIKNIPGGVSVNNERKNLNLLIAEWQKEMDFLSISKIDVAESEKIKKDTEAVKAFIKNLTEIIKNLTPANSGLSQEQIDMYLSQLPSVDSVDQVLVSIQSAIETSKAKTAAESGGSAPTAPLVTPEEVLAEQKAVVDAQNQMTALQEQLARIEEQISQSSPNSNSNSGSTPPPTPPEVDTSVVPPVPVNPTPTDPNNVGPQYNSEDMLNSIKNRGPSIIVQPGPPRLIQGTNQY